MKLKIKKIGIGILIVVLGYLALNKEKDMNKNNVRLLINGNSREVEISETLYGLFFEDINFALDGGMYAEKVINRSFEFNEKLAEGGAIHGYSSVNLANLTVLNETGLNENNPSYLHIEAKEDNAGFVNKGFLEGMSFEAGEEYIFTVYIRGNYDGRVKVSLNDKNQNEISSGLIENINSEWTKKEVVVNASETVEKGSLSLVLENAGEVDVDMVSLFPVNTYKNRQNGLRVDMVEMLEQLNPSFLRFPGGCIVEGSPIGNAYNWKDTVGDVAQRKQNENLWLGTQKYPYYQSYGVGFYEYFLLCEDLNAKAVPIINCGMSCQARAGDHSVSETLVSLEELDSYIQDALDLVEFCRGDENTKWGKIRIDMGHPETFEIEYIGIGNEQWGEEYFKRYIKFVEVFREKYPDIKLITTSGPLSSGDLFDYAWNKINQHKYDDVRYTDMVDEHYYNQPEWFLKNANRYDSYDRNGFDVFLGEYAAKENTLQAALAEAAYMTSLERNSDIVKMAAYAPLFGNTVSSQWAPDMIWFNNSEVFGSINYYVQKMFANNVGDYTLKSSLENIEYIGVSGKIGVGTWKTSAVFDEIKVVDNKTGKVLYSNNFDSELEGFDGTSQGLFGIIQDVDGKKVYAQQNNSYPTNDAITGSASYVGNVNWSDYTYTVRAKKISGEEGFLIPFAVKDKENFYHWNIGGWNNTRSVVEEALGGTKNMVSQVKSMNIKNDEWYDIKVVVKENNISCYLNDELIHTIDVPKIATVYQSVTKDENSKDIIVKLVNVQNKDVNITLELENCNITGKAQVEILHNEDVTVKNNLKEPEKVVPIVSDIEITENYEYTMLKNSISILRIKTN